LTACLVDLFKTIILVIIVAGDLNDLVLLGLLILTQHPISLHPQHLDDIHRIIPRRDFPRSRIEEDFGSFSFGLVEEEGGSTGSFEGFNDCSQKKKSSRMQRQLIKNHDEKV